MVSPTDLFALHVEEQKLHPQFRSLRDSNYYHEARLHINTLYQRMGTPSKTFISHFQADGFHSHLFEIACFAYLESAALKPKRKHSSPDFLATHNGFNLAFEATTANPVKQASDISLLQMEELSQQEIVEKENVEFPRRMGKILKKKLGLNYDKLPQPLILMIAPFFEPGSVYYIDESLLNCLYGINNVTPGFFHLEKAKSVSAIMYCNAFTVPRFFRLATTIDDSAKIIATREGLYYAPQSDGGIEIREYKFLVDKPSSPKESWAEGVTVFHNPNALHPIPTTLLPCTSYFSVNDGFLTREVHGFHPLTSLMKMYPK
ncbi:MAG: hypothetical protein B7Y56_11750 [Gallionellales bacterium 35-53-114]|nr:MAG: hypothetical protein B7Y56_11750 [Gallionellales bacterium 35-53-114]